jgi:hypothetical protein
MRTSIALAVIAATFALGDCFHHNQATYVTELPPAAVPYK